MTRLAARVARRLRYAGWTRQCPGCGARLRRYEPYSELGTQCPRCGAKDRHRLVALYLRQRSMAARSNPRVLHFAPEAALRDVVAALGPAAYLSADIEPGAADLEADITDLPLDDGSFDLVICSHVLEHIPDDAAALRELARVTASSGEALILSPVSYALDATVEDPDTTPAERLRYFGQEDHVRVYGPDLAQRIEAAGMTVERFDPDDVPERDRAAAGISREVGAYGLRNEIYVGRPRAPR